MRPPLDERYRILLRIGNHPLPAAKNSVTGSAVNRTARSFPEGSGRSDRRQKEVAASLADPSPRDGSRTRHSPTKEIQQ